MSSAKRALNAHKYLAEKYHKKFNKTGNKKYGILAHYHSSCRIDVSDLERKLKPSEKKYNFDNAQRYFNASIVSRNYD